jgi:hypothetical protein
MGDHAQVYALLAAATVTAAAGFAQPQDAIALSLVPFVVSVAILFTLRDRMAT